MLKGCLPSDDESRSFYAIARRRKIRQIYYAMIAEFDAMVVAEDADWIAINKPSGLAVQGGSGTTRHVDGK